MAWMSSAMQTVIKVAGGITPLIKIGANPTQVYNEALQVVAEAPTVDAVEVVRCRDCTYWGDEDGKLQGSDGVLFARCKAHNYLIDGRHTGWCPTENDFCSYGERKDGDGNG